MLVAAGGAEVGAARLAAGGCLSCQGGAGWSSACGRQPPAPWSQAAIVLLDTAAGSQSSTWLRGPRGGRLPSSLPAEAHRLPLVLLGDDFSLTWAHEAHVDQKNKVVTTPAFMCETALHHIHDGIGAMVKEVLQLTGK